MKKEQIDNKFIICRTQDELEFVVHHVDILLNYKFSTYYGLPVVIRTYDPGNDYGKFGNAGVRFWTAYGYKEEEASVLFGNLIRRWKHEKGTT